MKTLEFETSKGKFRLVDEKDYMVFHSMIIENGFYYLELKEITEEQSSEIVSFEEEYNISLYSSAKNKLHSLLKSKGIHLFENPYADKIGITDFDYHRNKAEQKTFYNPYIFKL